MRPKELLRRRRGQIDERSTSGTPGTFYKGGAQEMDVIHYLALAAARLVLHRRTLHRPERAEDAAVAGFGAQQHVTAGALIVELAGIRGHGFLLGEAAMRASQHRFKSDSNHRDLTFLLSRPRFLPGLVVYLVRFSYLFRVCSIFPVLKSSSTARTTSEACTQGPCGLHRLDVAGGSQQLSPPAIVCRCATIQA